MERNYTPMNIPTSKVQALTFRNAEYSQAVRAQIASLVMPLAHDFSDYTNDWLFEIEWKTDGDRLHKRIANMVFKTCRVRMPSDTLNKIAEIASRERERTIHFDVTKRFQWEPGAFGDKGSCYWGSFKPARIAYLPKLGAVSVRMYTEQPDKSLTGAGRFWLMPMPHVGMDTADRVIAFNFYGGFQNGENVTELAQHILGDEFTHVPEARYHVSLDGCYVNDGQVMMFYRKGTGKPNVNSDAKVSFEDMLASTLPLPKWGMNEPDYDVDDE